MHQQWLILKSCLKVILQSPTPFANAVVIQFQMYVYVCDKIYRLDHNSPFVAIPKPSLIWVQGIPYTLPS